MRVRVVSCAPWSLRVAYRSSTWSASATPAPRRRVRGEGSSWTEVQTESHVPTPKRVGAPTAVQQPPRHRDDDVPRDGHALLARAGRDGDNRVALSASSSLVTH